LTGYLFFIDLYGVKTIQRFSLLPHLTTDQSASTAHFGFRSALLKSAPHRSAGTLFKMTRIVQLNMFQG
jgi:hypothetical protein